MKFTIKRKNELSIAKWAGGSTTELFIFPPFSTYKERNFEIRVSSATVEDSPSIFTSLPSYHRVLMPINASLRLVFESQDETYQNLFDINNEVNLKPFESIHFEGEWNTVSYGICKDIGAMFSDNFEAKLIMAKDGIQNCKDGFACIYSLYDNVQISTENNKITLNEGDFAIFEIIRAANFLFTLPKENTAVLSLISRK